MIPTKLKEYGADFSLLLVAIAWGGTFFIVQDAIEEVSVYVFLFWRFFFATVLMSIIFFPHVIKISKETFKAGVILGFLMFLGFAFQTFGLTYTYSSTVAFITGLNVIIVPFAVFVLFAKKASIYSIFGAICAIIGLYFLTKNEATGGFGIGEIYSFICAVAFALHITFTDLFAKKHNSMALVSVQFATVALFSLLGAFIIDGAIMPRSFDGVFLQALIITVLFATIFAFLVQTIMQKFTTPAKAAIIFTMEPVSAGVFGYYFAGEHFSLAQIAGAGFILFGIVCAEIGAYLQEKKIRSHA
ncbi:MAG: DMT family transporter [Sulfurospirillum sp.]|nr:DMT family transporter [Sulfurospirillum sp.]